MMTTIARPARFTPTAAPMKPIEAMLRWARVPAVVVVVVAVTLVVGAAVAAAEEATRAVAAAVATVNQYPHTIKNQSRAIP
jgi:hypothetical protein